MGMVLKNMVQLTNLDLEVFLWALTLPMSLFLVFKEIVIPNGTSNKICNVIRSFKIIFFRC